MAQPPHHCGGCPARWGGANTSHCSRCHITFSGVSNFDEHQKRDRCLSVAEMFLLKRGGLHEVRPGIFGRPTPAQTPTVTTGGDATPDADVRSLDYARVSHRVAISLDQYLTLRAGGPAMLGFELGRLQQAVERQTAGLPVTRRTIYLTYEEAAE